MAHSDVVKAQLEANDRNRDLQESTLAEEKARLALAVLIFPNFTRDYQVVDDLSVVPSLPELHQVQDLAANNNPELKAAVAAMRASEQEVTSAIGGHLPSLSINYFYGIDATQYATKTDGVNNLGYQVSATLNLPIWNWGATQSRVKQAQLRRDQSKLELSAAQRQAIADLQTLYSEAQLARNQLRPAASIRGSRAGKPAVNRYSLSGRRGHCTGGSRCSECARPGPQQLRRWAGEISRGDCQSPNSYRELLSSCRLSLERELSVCGWSA